MVDIEVARKNCLILNHNHLYHWLETNVTFQSC